MGKKGFKNYNGKSRLICYDSVTTNGKNFYLCRWDQSKWEKYGGGKSPRELYPLIDGSRYDFFVDEKTKEELMRFSLGKFSKLVEKLPLAKPF